MNDRPTFVKIGGMDWKLQWQINAARGSNLGQICYGNGTITIDAEQPPDSIWNTLWHEILHAVLKDCGFEVGRDAKEIENVVYPVAAAICQVIRDNPWLGQRFEHGEAVTHA